MSDQVGTQQEHQAPIGGRGMTHIPRDVNERPLHGLCGCVPPPTVEPRDRRTGEAPSCVVCHELAIGLWGPGYAECGS